MKLFSLSIISPGNILYEGEAVSLIAPCANGYLGVLADHAPLIAKTLPGKITLTKPNNEKIFFDSTTEGVLEVISNQVSIILHKEI
jgi:F-type H+-transporting ATPase subunit epsilon